MAFTDLLLTGPGEFSLAYLAQSDLTTPAAGTFVAVDCLLPIPSWDVETGSDPKSSGQRGARAKTSVGRKIGTLPIRAEMPGQVTAFDASSGAPVPAGAWSWVDDTIGGNATGAYAAGDVDTGSAANSVVHTASTLTVGCAYAYGASDSTISCIGWVESVSTVTATLRHDMRAIPASGDNVYPLYTMFTTSGQPTPNTFKLMGDSANHDMWMHGGILESVSLSLDNGGRLWGDFTHKIYAGSDQGTTGALLPIISRQQISEYSGRGKAHLVIASAHGIGTQDDGTADDEGICGTSNHTISITWPHALVECPGATERIGAVKVRAPEVTISFDVEASPEWWDADGEFLFDSLFQTQTPFDWALSMGADSGSLFAATAPALLVNSRPTMSEKDGRVVYTVEASPGVYSGDGAATGAGQQPFAIAVG
ncbi:MAG: hypothetical protein ACI9MR_000013 [Myxococcota bacterium]|jgi:hypothetical protein